MQGTQPTPANCQTQTYSESQIAAAKELLKRRAARKSLIEFAKQIEVPGAPINEDAEEFLRAETPLAAHHLLILEAAQRCIEKRNGRLMIFMPPGSAKALALDTPIPTPSGWKAMGDLRIGDQVFDEKGKPCDVTWVSPVWKDRPVYRVTTDCGDAIIADKEHEWLVRLCGKRDVFKIKETQELYKKRSKRPMIKRAKALELPETDLPMDPYFLGVWLGDGNGSGLRVTSSVEDQPWLRSELERLGFETRNTSVPTLFGVIGIRDKFVKLGLINDPWHNTYGRKHVPPIYLRASKQQRLSLLQGLVDTDGTVCGKRGCTTFTNTNIELAQAVYELAHSLGVKAGWSEGRAKLYGKDCGPYYRISFYLKDSARMPRKAILTRNQYRTPNTYIDLEPAGIADTVCIEVNSPSHLFLCGKSMTPTHNSSYGSVVVPVWAMGRQLGYKVIAVSYGSDLARKWGRKTRSIVRQKRYKAIFGTELSGDNAAVDDWSLSNGSEYMSGGILSGITGNRANLVVVDDPVKGREEAESETIRRKTINAFDDDVRTRLLPGGSAIIIQTRWHESDLAGSILPEGYSGESGLIQCRDGQEWEVICLPAKAERADDPLGRKVGEYIWPEWFDREHWKQFERKPRTWASLYQQRPAPEEGDFFQKAWIKPCFMSQIPERLNKYGASDYAVTSKGGDYTVHGVIGIDASDQMWLVDVWRAQADSSVWVEAFCDIVKLHKPIGWAEETGQIKSGVGPFLDQRMRERQAYVARETFPTKGDKATRAQSIRGRMALNGLNVPVDAPWYEAFLSEMLTFPTGRNDDQVDMLGLLGQLLDKMYVPRALDKPKPKDELPDWFEEKEYDDETLDYRVL